MDAQQQEQQQQKNEDGGSGKGSFLSLSSTLLQQEQQQQRSEDGGSGKGSFLSGRKSTLSLFSTFMDAQQQRSEDGGSEKGSFLSGRKSTLPLFSTFFDAQQQEQQQRNEDGGSGKGSFLSGQKRTRWKPTTDQVRILEELYHNNGVRCPCVDLIQRTTTRLRQYGEIEGQNVVDWFQIHKALDMQKIRLTTAEPVVPLQKPSGGNGGSKCPTSSNEVSPTTAPSTARFVVWQMGSCGGFGSATMEKSFRDCSMTHGGSTSFNVGTAAHNFGCVGVDLNSSPCSALFGKRKLIDLENGEEEVEENQEEVETPELETLPLFPMHGDDINGFCNMKFPATSDGFYTTRYWTSEKSGSRISLELSLRSYSGTSGVIN